MPHTRLSLAVVLATGLIASPALAGGNYINRLKSAFVKKVNEHAKKNRPKDRPPPRTKNGGPGVRGYISLNAPPEPSGPVEANAALNYLRKKLRKYVKKRGNKPTTRPNTSSGVRGYTSSDDKGRGKGRGRQTSMGVRGYVTAPEGGAPDGDYLCQAAIADVEVDIGVASVTALQAIRQLSAAGGIQDLPKVYKGKVGSAIAAIMNGQRTIIYNPEFMRVLENDGEDSWIAYSVLAHELGHHANGHTFDGHGDSWLQELQADYYSGYLLGRLGATQAEAEAALRTWSKVTDDVDGTVLHPPVPKRIAQVAKGWREGSAQIQRRPEGPSGPAASAPVSLYHGDLEKAATARLADASVTDVLERRGLEELKEAGRLINKRFEGAARSSLFRLESHPQLGDVAKFWVCKSYLLENNPLRAEDCFKDKGIDPKGQ